MKELKELIKQLSAEQIELKKQRKTGTLPSFTRDEWGYFRLRDMPEDAQTKIRKSWDASSAVRRNKARITAALNLYHELRGSTYRHNITEEASWWYRKDMEALRLEFAAEAAE